jgi:hypothetical protein
MSNKGIINYGKMDVVNVAVGDAASIETGDQYITIPGSDKEEISNLLLQVKTMIEQSREAVPEKSAAIASVEALQTEVQKEKPNKSFVSTMGKTILENLKYVKDVAVVFQLAWDKIQLFF